MSGPRRLGPCFCGVDTFLQTSACLGVVGVGLLGGHLISGACDGVHCCVAQPLEALVTDGKLHTPHGIAQTLRHTTPNLSVRRRLGEIAVPTLLICGTRERRFTEGRMVAEQTIPNLRVVDTEAGHAVNIEAADAFNAAVREFVLPYLAT